MITYGPTTQGDFAVADSGIVTGRYKAESLAYQAASELASPDVPRRTHFQIANRPPVPVAHADVPPTALVEAIERAMTGQSNSAIPSVFNTPPPPALEEAPAQKPTRKKTQR